MKRLKILTAIALSAMLTVTVTGCQSSQSAQSSQKSMDGISKADNKENNMLYGQVSAVSKSEITVKIAEQRKEPGEMEFTGDEQTIKVTEETEVFKESGMAGGPQGEMPKNRTKPEEEGEEPKMPEKPEGEERNKPEESQGEKEEAPKQPNEPQGEKEEAPKHPTEEAKISDIQSGDMIRIALDGDKAVTITIQNIPSDVQGTTASETENAWLSEKR